ncbi:unnamed protein product [Callosobruchus maculatus]|uniref:Chitin-binding type-2 domain-containing protein n=1 Tax=Callosobruchus maculatus TaxID=64391 RepID=A0A653CEG3_CALMS|nr:unnamed protein product [Callosobruchus maculatus]
MPTLLFIVYQNVATSSDIQTFVCEKPGYFENPSDLSCRTFYQCITFLGGLIPVSFTCPIFTNFDPELQICSLSYACPSNKSLVAAERRSDALPEVSLDNDYPIDPHMEVIRSCTRFKCTSEGIFEDPDTCGKYYVCSKFFESYVVTHNPCPVFAGFDPVYRMCSFSKTCLPPIERCIPQDQHHKEESCIYVDYQDYFQCKRPGYFRNLNDPTCETYHYCKPTEAGGMFIKETYRCSNGSHFNPHVKKCDTNYICPCSESNSATVTTNIPGIEDEEENMREVVKKYESSLKVTEVDSESARMSSIVRNKSDNAAERNVAVDLSETSNREVAFHSEFSFESLHNIDPEWTNYTKCTPNTSESFECWTKGRFLDPGDTSCQSYFLCNLLRNGSFVKTRYLCPKGSSFNPSSSVCDIQYNCPCEVYTTTLPSSTTDESALSKLTSMTESDGSFLTEASGCNYQKSPDYFTCNKKGRFENLNDLTCESYFLCNLLRNGSFLKTEYLCPKGSYFNPTLSICSKSYTCPCTSATTTSTSAATVTATEATEISSVATTTGQNDCRYDSNPEYFTCSEKGRSEDLNDLTCQSYYLCNLLKNGSFVKTRYSCPKGSSFNPHLGVCDTQYICPCVGDVTTISSSTTDITESSTTTENGFTKPDDSATTEAPVCDYQEDPEYFGCTSKGRFENLNDLSCESYFLCSLLRNGSFLRTKYVCPKGSYFNPNLSICSKSYICPCNGHTTVSSTTASSTATEETTEISSVATTTEQKRCKYEDNPEYFTCSEKGRFEDLNDLTCQSYYLCNLLKNGSFVKTRYSCPKGSSFNPPLGVCDTQYVCPCVKDVTTISSSTTGITESSTTENGFTKPDDSATTEAPVCDYKEDPEYYGCTSKGRFENLNDLNCESYFLCNLLRNGSFLKTKYVCPKGSYFNPNLSICSKSYICPCNDHTTVSSTTVSSTATEETTEISSVATTTEQKHCRYEDDPEYFTCSEKGRFEDLNDLTCQSYYLCNLLKNGSFVKTRYSCPKGSSFNPPLGVCDTQYVCPCIEDVTTISSSTTDITEYLTTTENGFTKPDDSATTEAPVCEYQEDPEYYGCTSEGRFENLNDLNCESYFLCNLLRNGSCLKTKYICPKGSYFNPNLSICSKSYICPCNGHITVSSTTASSTATEETTEQKRCRYEDDPEYFTCSEKGRFENLNDLTCQSYYLCNLLKNGSFVGTRYSCPNGSSFNPPLGVCDTQYVCPCVKDVTTISSSTTDITESSTTTENGFTKPDDSATTEAPVCDYKEDPEYYDCTRKGRFENLNDLNCESYFLCNLLRNGSFLKTKYVCPKGSYFNPNLSICSKSYICPCNGDITASSTTVSSTATEETTEISSVSTTTEQKRCRYKENPEYFTCSEKGRFEDLNDLTCQSYYLCNLLKNGSFVKTRYSCPKGSSFNPPLGVCDTQYVCPCVEDVTTISSSTTDITKSSTTTENGFTKPDDSATTEAPACDYKEDPEYYGCTSKGRFENLNDLNCESYFLCNLLRNGSFLRTKYVCPKGSYFNPNLSICNKSYICPCNGHTTASSTTASSTLTEETTEISSVATTTEQKRCRYEDNPEYFTCSEKGRFEDLNDLTCQSYYLCNLLKNGSFVKTRYSCPKGSGFNPPLGVCDTQYVCPCVKDVTTISSSTTDITESLTTTENGFTKPDDSATTEAPVCDYQEDPEYFGCTSKGRFENLNDLNCESYFLCNLLRNGSFLKTKYVCPKGSYFNPNLSICSKSYICPCNGYTTVSSTTVSSTATEEATEISSVSTTTEQKHCRYEENPEYFTCLEKGRFEDLNDLTCQSYHLCNLLKNGSFVRTRYSCPNGSNFNPSLGVCDTQYVCPCVEDVTAVSSSTTNLNEPSTTSETRVTEPDDEVITEVPVCDYQEDPDYFNCTGKGRFENLNDLNCESYFLCNLLRNGSFLKTKYLCPKGSYFNPNLSICGKSYTCPCNSRMTTESTTVFSTVTENTEASGEADNVLTTEGVVCDYQQDPEYFACTKKGRLENLNDLACETYFLCNLLRNGSFLKTKYSCPKGSYFNPSLNICSTKYTCPCSSRITTESSNEYNATTEANTADCSTSTESACVYEDDPDYFSCTINGSFANHNDPTCETFLLCNLLGNGTFIKTKYSCPKGLFNPDLGLCDSNFSCPCSEKNLDKRLSDFSSSPVPE